MLQNSSWWSLSQAHFTVRLRFQKTKSHRRGPPKNTGQGTALKQLFHSQNEKTIHLAYDLAEFDSHNNDLDKNVQSVSAMF